MRCVAQMPPHMWYGVLQLHQLVRLLSPLFPIGQLVPYVPEAAAALQGFNEPAGRSKPAKSSHVQVKQGRGLIIPAASIHSSVDGIVCMRTSSAATVT